MRIVIPEGTGSIQPPGVNECCCGFGGRQAARAFPGPLIPADFPLGFLDGVW